MLSREKWGISIVWISITEIGQGNWVTYIASRSPVCRRLRDRSGLGVGPGRIPEKIDALLKCLESHFEQFNVSALI